MSSNLREIAAYQKRYRKGGMRITLKTSGTWTTQACIARSRTLVRSKHPLWKRVIVYMLLLTPLQLNHLVSCMINYNELMLQSFVFSFLSIDPVLKAICARARRRDISIIEEAGLVCSHRYRRRWLLTCSCSSASCWWSYLQTNAVDEQVTILLSQLIIVDNVASSLIVPSSSRSLSLPVLFSIQDIPL